MNVTSQSEDEHVNIKVSSSELGIRSDGTKLFGKFAETAVYISDELILALRGPAAGVGVEARVGIKFEAGVDGLFVCFLNQYPNRVVEQIL